MSRTVTVFLIVFLATGALDIGQSSPTASLNDPIANLGRQIERGDVKLEYSSDGWGYLRSLLKNLNDQIDSQVLARPVFS